MGVIAVQATLAGMVSWASLWGWRGLVVAVGSSYRVDSSPKCYGDIILRLDKIEEIRRRPTVVQ
ncbi:hypothetical protein F441_04660 [Phytophthora nicotianae CJ01A1]|uniref:Uncharacterized protein n=2 Tax=Phytophthora nicotianae TaxID=4792 RepID=W2ZRC0_PHYNI|nr:hypothetical protein F441_04660 [Phytophthora nicotianae CJ01A1]ETP49838.1 hypothetical protein F442_04723 [Phytophthora nicotianae P10297]